MVFSVHDDITDKRYCKNNQHLHFRVMLFTGIRKCERGPEFKILLLGDDSCYDGHYTGVHRVLGSETE